MRDRSNAPSSRISALAGLLVVVLAIGLALPSVRLQSWFAAAELYLPVMRQAHRLYLPPGMPSPTAGGQGERQTLFGPALLTALGGRSGFVTRLGEELQLNGRPYTFVGANASYLASPFFPATRMEEVIATLAARGSEVIRVWTEPWCDLDRVEEMLDLGGQYGVRFILTLQDFYGRTDGYWFKEEFKTKGLPHIRRIVPRFAGRPEILMWELMNEPTCPAEDADRACWEALCHWAQITSQEIKKLDANHLVAAGTQRAGFEPQAIEAFRRIHALSTIDIVSVHGQAGKLGRGERELERSIAQELGKPIYFGEVYRRGMDDRCQTLPQATLQERAAAIASDLEQLTATGIDGYLLWQYAYGTVELDDGTTQHFCGVYDYGDDDPAWEILLGAR
jgi:mannan endo-1,4-beta-mannosidase